MTRTARGAVTLCCLALGAACGRTVGSGDPDLTNLGADGGLGDECSGTGVAAGCYDAQYTLECRSGRWSLRRCLGGCRTEGAQLICLGIGDTCPPDAGHNYDCAGVISGTECRASKVVAFPCRGGCVLDGGVTCFVDPALAGDACPSAMEGSARCAHDRGSTLECRSGVWVATNTCRACSYTGDVVVCEP